MTYPDNIRAAFREVTLGLCDFSDALAPLCSEVKFPPRAPWQRPTVYRCWDKQGETDPFNVQADWEECNE